MANVSGDSPLTDPSKLNEQQVSQPSFPNTRPMDI